MIALPQQQAAHDRHERARQQGAACAAATVPKLRCVAHTKAQSPPTHITNMRAHNPAINQQNSLKPTYCSIYKHVTLGHMACGATGAWLQQ